MVAFTNLLQFQLSIHGLGRSYNVERTITQDRMFADAHVAFMWPVIITEMVRLFSYLELELISDKEQFK